MEPLKKDPFTGITFLVLKRTIFDLWRTFYGSIQNLSGFKIQDKADFKTLFLRVRRSIVHIAANWNVKYDFLAITWQC